MLATVALAIGHEQLGALIDRLETAGFITSELVNMGWGATRRVDLLQNGRDIVQRRVSCDWITLPNTN